VTIYGQTIATEGIAPGDNEVLMWDVVIITLDGTSHDTVGYVIDCSNIYGLQVVSEHLSAPTSHHMSDKTDTSYVYAHHQEDAAFYIYYGAVYDASDTVKILIHYIA